jgi:DNA-binding response OmpR family regulator
MQSEQNPLTHAHVRYAPTSPSIGRTPELRHRRILVADDDMDTTLSLATLLRLEGHEVTWANDGRSALQEFDEFKPDVAILDLGMPHVSGHELARQIRHASLDRSVLLIAVSGWARSSDVQKSRLAGFDHHLIKPVEFGVIASLL